MMPVYPPCLRHACTRLQERNKDGFNPLHLAAIYNRSAVAKLLVAAVGGLSRPDKKGRTAADLAARRGHEVNWGGAEGAGSLVQSRVRPGSAWGNTGRTAAGLAARSVATRYAGRGEGGDSSMQRVDGREWACEDGWPGTVPYRCSHTGSYLYEPGVIPV